MDQNGVPPRFLPYVLDNGKRVVLNGILRSVPGWLKNLSGLTELDLSGNLLTAVPEWLGNLTALTALDLSDNQLTAVPDSLGNLTALTELDLSDNQLTEIGRAHV